MLNNFYAEMISNLQVVGIVFVVFIAAVLANIFASSFYNIHVLQEHWDNKRFVSGIIKMMILGITTGILSMIVTSIPYILSLAGITIAEETENIYVVTAIVGLYVNGILKYYKKSFNTIKEIIEDRDIIEDVEEININFEGKEED